MQAIVFQDDNNSIVLLSILCCFELKAIVINGEFPGAPEEMRLSDSALYTLEFIRTSPVESLYSFNLTENVLDEIKEVSKLYCNRYMNHRFKSLEILEINGES